MAAGGKEGWMGRERMGRFSGIGSKTEDDGAIATAPNCNISSGFCDSSYLFERGICIIYVARLEMAAKHHGTSPATRGPLFTNAANNADAKTLWPIYLPSRSSPSTAPPSNLAAPAVPGTSSSSSPSSSA